MKEEWNAIIEAKLKEGISIEDLKYEYSSGIIMEPNVMKSDLAIYNHKVKIDHAWINMTVIAGGNSNEKNTLALQSLQQGANGLSIELLPEDSIQEILKDVLTNYLDVRVDCSQLGEHEVEAQITSLNKIEYPNVRWVGSRKDFKELRITEKERVNSIQNCLKNIDSNTDVVVTLSKNLLFEIASLRALRVLFDEKGISNYNIICRYEIEGTNELGDYNLIEKTYKILSAILGGANAILTPYAGDEDSRLTLNIHNVLDLESRMKSVMDPLAGAYYIEKLTGEIIRQVKS